MAGPDVIGDDASVGLPTSPRLAALTRQLLVVLGRISGLESTYLTLVDVGQQVQQILYARNTGDLELPEGLEVDWTDTLCRPERGRRTGRTVGPFTYI
jgi:diguanylate cyclase